MTNHREDRAIGDRVLEVHDLNVSFAGEDGQLKHVVKDVSFEPTQASASRSSASRARARA
ncbi:hypothetical protein [Aeromicrobium sp. UC242_57]|uniref:hypothetical protein n=1 Tax=Aeromicrobium sp. UC242_57 TaxID=3374624 RepID=UPI0037AAFBB8